MDSVLASSLVLLAGLGLGAGWLRRRRSERVLDAAERGALEGLAPAHGHAVVAGWNYERNAPGHSGVLVWQFECRVQELLPDWARAHFTRGDTPVIADPEAMLVRALFGAAPLEALPEGTLLRCEGNDLVVFGPLVAAELAPEHLAGGPEDQARALVEAYRARSWSVIADALLEEVAEPIDPVALSLLGRHFPDHPGVADAVTRALTHPTPAVRLAAAGLQRPLALDTIGEVAGDEAAPLDVRQRALRMLDDLGARPTLLDVLAHSGGVGVERELLRALQRTPTPEVVAFALRVLRASEDEGLTVDAADVLSVAGGRAALDALTERRARGGSRGFLKALDASLEMVRISVEGEPGRLSVVGDAGTLAVAPSNGRLGVPSDAD